MICFLISKYSCFLYFVLFSDFREEGKFGSCYSFLAGIERLVSILELNLLIEVYLSFWSQALVESLVQIGMFKRSK